MASNIWATLAAGGRGGVLDEAPGRAVQGDPIKPKLKAAGTKRLKLEYDILFSNFGFKFNVRRYSLEVQHVVTQCFPELGGRAAAGSSSALRAFMQDRVEPLVGGRSRHSHCK